LPWWGEGEVPGSYRFLSSLLPVLSDHFLLQSFVSMHFGEDLCLEAADAALLTSDSFSQEQRFPGRRFHLRW